MAHLEILVPHDVNILPNDAERFDFESDVERLGGLPRAEEKPTLAGEVTIYDSGLSQAFNLYEVAYGNVTNLPPYDPDAYYVVSKPTIAAALRDPTIDRDFTDRLLFPYEPVRDPVTNEFLGVRGLARAIPVKRYKPEGINVPPLESFEIEASELQNTCPYPFKLYDKVAQSRVPADYPVAMMWEAAPSDTALTVRYAEPELNIRLTNDLGGVPIYETEVIGVNNDNTETDEAWRLCHIDVPPALRSVAGALTMLDLVRLQGKHASVLGGKALARLAPHHYDEPII